VSADPRTRFQKLAQAYASGDLDGALVLADQLLRAFPDQAPLHWHRARILRALGRLDAARQALEKVIELKPDYAPALLLRAELRWELGEDAEPDLRAALALDPSLARAHLMLARRLAGEREAESAAALERAIELDPKLAEAWAERGERRHRAAKRGFGDAVAPDPDHIVASSGQRFSRSALEAARRDFETSLAVRNDPKVRLKLAAVLHDLQDFDAALAAYDAVLAVTPSDDPRHAWIRQMRARSENGGQGEEQAMADRLAQALAYTEANARPGQSAESTLGSSAAAVSAGISLEAARANFVGEHPDDVVAVDLAWQIFRLGHEPPPDYQRSAIARYPRFLREQAQRVAREMGRHGYRIVGDFEPKHRMPQLERATLVRFYAAADGVTCAASYCIEPKWPGWIAFLWLKLMGRWQRMTVFEAKTGFDDGGILITNNAPGPFVQRGQVEVLSLPADTPPPVIHSRHRERIERYRRDHPHATAERVDTEERILAFEARVSAARSAFRRSIGYVEDHELKQLLGDRYDRLAARVRAKLEAMRQHAGG
jgi:tetratricopeptide (TPR) repeat protein